MLRRIISVLAILALALTIAPSGLDAASLALDCCNGIMCPMHPAQVHPPNCDMSGNGPPAALRPCPVQNPAHYTGAVVFVPPTPTVLHHHTQTEPAFAFFPTLSPSAERRMDSPPPRLPLTA